MSLIASQITSLRIVYSTVYSGADHRKHQGSASLAFVRAIHRWPVNSPHKGPVTRKMFHLMASSWFVKTLSVRAIFTSIVLVLLCENQTRKAERCFIVKVLGVTFNRHDSLPIETAPQNKMAAFCRRHFQRHFHGRNVSWFEVFQRFASSWPNGQYVTIGSANGS